MRRLRICLVRVVVHGRRRRTNEYRAARVFEQVLEQRHFDGRSATGGPTVVVVVEAMVAVVAVVIVVVPRLLLRQCRQRKCRRKLLLLLLRLLLRGHRTLSGRTVGQIVGYELFRFRVHVGRTPDAYPGAVVAGRRVLRGLRRPLVLVPFQYRLRPPMWFRRTVYRFGRHRCRGLTTFPCNNRSNWNDK